MTITRSLNHLSGKGKNLLDTPPPTYPGVPLTQLDNTLSNRNIEIRGNDRSGDIDCGEKNRPAHTEAGAADML